MRTELTVEEVELLEYLVRGERSKCNPSMKGGSRGRNLCDSILEKLNGLTKKIDCENR